MANSYLSFDDWDLSIQSRLADIDGGRMELNLLHINVRSVQKHWDQLNVYLQNRLACLDILILTEVNIDSTMVSSFNLTGFQLFSDCREGRRGGGILVFIKHAWISDQLAVSCKHAEVLVLCVSNRELSFVICAVYRPPSANIPCFLDELTEIFKQFNNNKYLVVAGDLNIDVMNAAKHGVSDYLNLLAGFGLENIITDYTREEYLGSRITKSCIDHIIVRGGDLKTFSGVIRQKVADHYFIALAIIGVSPEKTNRVVYRRILDNNKIDKMIREYNWASLLAFDHITTYQMLGNNLRSIYEKCWKTVKIRQRNPQNAWINDEILTLCREKDRLWNICKARPHDPIIKGEFKKTT